MTCSLIRTTAASGEIISGRTMEFGEALPYAVSIVPRNYPFNSPNEAHPDGGLFWQVRYGYVAVQAMPPTESACDGLNEAGLAVSGLWYDPGHWPQLENPDDPQAIASTYLTAWLLGNCATVDDIKQQLPQYPVFGYTPIPKQDVIPFHFAAQDASGGSIVIEWEHGNLNIYDNPIGVMTNAPAFPWMITNLRNFVGMTCEHKSAQTYDLVLLPPTGHGNGMWGLPGDITPPSRFVRLAVLLHYANLNNRPTDAWRTLQLARHVLHNVKIPLGTIVDRDPSGKISAEETTQWTAFRDLTNRVFYFDTYDNATLRKIALKNCDFTATEIKMLSMQQQEEIITLF